ncbi:kelch repeat-containing protein [Corallococcus macrosporus]|uniref:kelch repeat-containing protein n=1 Tax=Corallococcus macrosporus TaxID=35 RepID=UPI001EE692F0|nr:kelch repeat-containing protein [Corallococcus macrosporus]
MQSHRAVWSRRLLLVGSVILLSCGKQEPTPPGDDALAAARGRALAQWKQAPSSSTGLALAQAYFPDLGTAPAPSAASARQLDARLADDGALTLTTRGLTFHVRPAASATDALRRERSAAFQGARHLWWPVGPTTPTPEGWRTSRVEEAWILDAPEEGQRHRAEYTVTLPPSVRRIQDTGAYLQFLDERERPVLRFHPSAVRDANGQSREGTTRLEGGRVNPRTQVFDVEGAQVRITTEVSLAGLTAPLVVDPGWSSTATMATARAQHAGILLGTGELLITGGVNRTGFVTTSERYDPVTDTWSAASAPGITGNVTQAALLADGRVLVVADGSTTGRLYDATTNTWEATGPMAASRSLSTLTRLDSSQLLIAGGSNLSSAELYDPATNTFQPTGAMSTTRRAHASARLRDGRVLAASGFSATGEVPSADLYDPAAGTWTPAAPPLVPRHYATGTLLPDGRVLLAGGFAAAGVTTHAELYDPAANTWTATGSLNFPRNGHTATLLPDGRVLVVGGSDGTRATQTVSELYDPATGTWTATTAMANGRENGTTTLLPSGKVLTVGGFTSVPSLTFYADTEVYDPGVQGWSPAGNLSGPRVDPLVVLLSSDRVLVAGGRDDTGTALASASLYDRAANTWSPAASLATARAEATATTLASGEVLVVGGTNAGGTLATAERYTPDTNTWSAAPSLTRARHLHTATRLPDGRVLVVGGQDGAEVLASAELYDPATQAWTAAAPASGARAAHAATLLPDGRVLIAGGHGAGGAVLASAEVYDPTTNTWAPAGNLGQGRERFTLTLLPSGELLAAGGGGAGGVALATTERYSAATNTWTPDSPLTAARWGHTTTLMPSGTLLVTGGLSAPDTSVASAEAYNLPVRTWTPVTAPQGRGGAAVALPTGEVLLAGGTAATTAELYSDVLASPAWRPVVSAPETLYQTCPVVIEGQGFQGISGGSSGSYLDSATDFPLVRLRAAEGGRLWTLPATDMSATRATVRVPTDAPPGPHALSVFANAIPGGRMVLLRANTAPTAEAVRIATMTGVPLDITLTATDPDADQTLTWTIVTQPQHGTLSGTPPDLQYTPNPGYVGADSFTYRVSDCGLDSNEASVDVAVEATQPLAITCPEDTVIEATGPDGAPGTWPAATVTPGASGPATVTYSPAEGSTLPLGTTTVTAIAEDASGTQVTCSFQVEVRDTTPPALTCPADLQVASDDASGATVTFELPEATDTASNATVTSSPASGSTFRHGRHTVTVTATDAAGNEARCTFQVTVQATVISIAGGGCQASGGGAASSLALLVVLAWWRGQRRRSRTRARSWALAALIASIAPNALAQSTTGAIAPIDLERLRFTPAATDSLLVDTGHVLPEGAYRLTLMAGYERGILLLKGSDGQERSIIDYRVSGWLAGAWSPVDNLELSARLPVIIHQGGNGADTLVGVSAPASFGLGTPELGARYALLRRDEGAPVFLSLGLDVGTPGGTADAFGRQAGWAGLQVAPRVAVSRELGPVVLGASAGVRIRSTENEPGRDYGTELEQGLVVATRGKGLRAEIALQAAESLVEPDLALELLGGVRLPVGGGFEAYAIAGHGFTDIPGTPSIRAAAGIAWAHEPPAREDVCRSGRSHTPEQCPALDDDGDTVPNGKDRCPLEAGPPENDGCPDTDSDGDGVVDREDACPNEAGSAENKGCPDTDSDGDGVVDREDACPNEAGSAENKGCPDTDSDGDGVVDREDACPNEAGVAAHRGCPEPKPEPTPQAPATEAQTRLPTEHHVQFPVGQSTLSDEELRNLDAVADYLKANPGVSLRIEGHTDSTGPDELNRTLSQERADAVRTHLIQRGVAPSRLTAKGYGPDRPLTTNDTPEGRGTNRRVEFVTEPGGASPAR